MTDITRKRGDTYANAWVVTSETTGAVIDITDYDFLLTVDPEKAPVADTNNLLQIVGVIADGPNGLVEFAPSLEQSDNLGSYFYDVQMIDADGAIRTIDAGKYKFVQDITKD